MTPLNDKTFDAAVAAGPTLVKFTAPWCSPCRIIQLFLDEVMPEFPGVTFAAVNVDETDAMQLAAKFNVNVVPTLIAFQDGQPGERKSGIINADALRRWLQELSKDVKDAPVDLPPDR